MWQKKKTNSVTIQVSSFGQKSTAEFSNITKYFDPEKRGLLTELLRDSSSVRNIFHYHQIALNQMSAQLMANQIQVPTFELETTLESSNITKHFAPEKRGLLTEFLRSSSSIRNISHYHQTALNRMTAQLVAEAKQASPKQQQGQHTTRMQRLSQWAVGLFSQKKHTSQQ